MLYPTNKYNQRSLDMAQEVNAKQGVSNGTANRIDRGVSRRDVLRRANAALRMYAKELNPSK